MKKEFAKVFGLGLATVMMLSACGGNKGDETVPVTIPETTVAQETTQAPTTAPTETQAPTTAPTETQKPTETTAAAQGGETTSQELDWDKLSFTLDGKVFTIYYNFKGLQELGWDFDLADYGKPNGYVLNPGDSVASTITLENEKYITEENKYRAIRVNVGFKNVDDEIKDIKECGVSGFQIDAHSSKGFVEPCPEFSFLGLTFGSTKEDMERVLGTEYEEYRSEDLGYTSYTYDHDYSDKIRIVVYDEFGISSFEFHSYK